MLPLIFIAFGVMLVLVLLAIFFMYTRRPKPSLIKSISQKLPANKTTSAETTISSELDYNGAFFSQIRSKRALANRYEIDSPSAPSFVPDVQHRQWDFPRHHLHFKDILGEGELPVHNVVQRNTYHCAH